MATNYNDYVGYGPSTDNSGTRHAISHLPGTAEWEPDIYQIESGDYPMGGLNGVANLQAAQLNNRTMYLKAMQEQLKTEIEAVQPGTDKYNELLAMIKALEPEKENNRINHLERLVGNAYLAFEMANIDPDGYDGMIIETFDGTASEIDQAVATVTSVVSGDDSIDVTDSSGLIIGAHYQLTDGEKIEEVQVKSLNVSGSVKRVILTDTVKNQYTDGRAKLYRSSVAIYNGRAYGGGNVRTDDWDVNQMFSGSDTQVEIDSSIDYTNGSAFTLNGATLDENGHIVIGGPAIGIALVSTGGRVGTWARVDSEGDAYNG